MEWSGRGGVGEGTGPPSPRTSACRDRRPNTVRTPSGEYGAAACGLNNTDKVQRDGRKVELNRDRGATRLCAGIVVLGL